ncbi:4505_t:CDS:2 [Racocetra fulgida]|uniref:4505_t:CDS:1 n=1 Tax=Racocetra fulgida TaxID=60492 RepID=A0A9N9A9P8_9GLOM|nr:4505_t:CDS:2 [Racocetra fulgida]
MSTFLEKLAGIVLPIDHFGSHFNSNGIIENTNLAKQNFHYAEVIVEYVDEQIDLFILYVSWAK